MCGIGGVIDTRGNLNESLLEEMSCSIKHRGPDDSGTYFDKHNGVGLIHRRLSIIDLNGGHQPMSDSDEKFFITYNGEIYNYLELQKNLLNEGLKFKTNSDTEVIINIYKKYGIEGFSKLNGIFAFAIYDKENKKVILARDTFGVKPLYYSFTSAGFTFASEIKAILKNKNYKIELDYNSFHSFLTYRYNPSPQTMFKNIFKLNPGQYIQYNLNGDYKKGNYQEYIPTINNKISETDAIEKYSELLNIAVKRQLTSDVPLGLFLSGGVDSAALGYLMKKNIEGDFNSYSIGFDGKGNYNELADAKKTSEFINSNHSDSVLSKEDYLDFFQKSFYYLEEPVAEKTAPALYFLSKLASKDVKVVLAGQGADEPLAGYKRYYGEKQIEKYRTALNFLPLNMISQVLPRNERFKRAAYASKFGNELERFLAIYTIFSPEMKNKLLNEDIKRKMSDVDIELLKPLYMQSKNLNDSLSKILFMDTRMNLADDLLLFGDKMTMANSLEMRVPYLDKELIYFLESLPSDFKLNGSKHKYIHKKAVSKWLPDEIINRKKKGFETPMDEWLQESFADDARDILTSVDSASKNFFKIESIKSMIDLHKSGKENYLRHIFALLSFETWYKTFFENKTVSL